MFLTSYINLFLFFGHWQTQSHTFIVPSLQCNASHAFADLSCAEFSSYSSSTCANTLLFFYPKRRTLITRHARTHKTHRDAAPKNQRGSQIKNHRSMQCRIVKNYSDCMMLLSKIDSFFSIFHFSPA